MPTVSERDRERVGEKLNKFHFEEHFSSAAGLVFVKTVVKMKMKSVNVNGSFSFSFFCFIAFSILKLKICSLSSTS